MWDEESLPVLLNTVLDRPEATKELVCEGHARPTGAAFGLQAEMELRGGAVVCNPSRIRGE